MPILVDHFIINQLMMRGCFMISKRCNIIIICSDLVGWSSRIEFKTPPAAGSEELHFLIYGDMGKAPLDPSVEHYIQVTSFLVFPLLFSMRLERYLAYFHRLFRKAHETFSKKILHGLKLSCYSYCSTFRKKFYLGLNYQQHYFTLSDTF